MRPLDETDLEILRLLVEDARRPYREIADRVGLSGPSVSDRVERMRQAGVIRGFTVDVDRSRLGGGVAVLLDVTVRPDTVDEVREAVGGMPGAEHLFATADGHVLVQARVPRGRARELLLEHVDAEAIVDLEVRLVEEVAWRPGLEAAAFAVPCDECGNTVDEEGVRERLDGELYHFCCTSCRGRFVERYERIKQGA